jgi:hypothetical protein
MSIVVKHAAKISNIWSWAAESRINAPTAMTAMSAG